MKGATTAEEGPECEGRAARRLWAEAGERERILGCLRRRGEPGERREALREERGARPTTEEEAWRRCEDADRWRDLDGREARGERAKTTPLGAGERARSREQVRVLEGDESLE